MLEGFGGRVLIQLNPALVGFSASAVDFGLGGRICISRSLLLYRYWVGQTKCFLLPMVSISPPSDDHGYRIPVQSVSVFGKSVMFGRPAEQIGRHLTISWH